MTELLIALTLLVITATLWLLILTHRINHLRSDLNQVIAKLRARDAISRYESMRR